MAVLIQLKLEAEGDLPRDSFQSKMVKFHAGPIKLQRCKNSIFLVRTCVLSNHESCTYCTYIALLYILMASLADTTLFFVIIYVFDYESLIN